MDVEFIRERSYTPQLALVQLSLEDQCVLIDPIASVDLTPLDEIVLDPEVCKVMHAPAQDLELFFYRTGKAPHQVIDLQIAAAFLGLGNQISYQALVERVTGVTLNKGQTFTDWLQRPLSPSQEQYALDDVRYLLPCCDHLTEKLQERGRKSWAEEEYRRYENVDLYREDLSTLYRRVRRAGTLDSRGLAILRELVAWREEQAQEINRPRRRIMKDEILVELARARPGDLGGLHNFRGLHPREVKRYGRDLLSIVRRGMEVPEKECPPTNEHRGRLPREGEVLVEFLQASLKALCQEAEVSPTLVANAASLEKLVRQHLGRNVSQDELPILSGWRRELVGARLLSLLEGDLRIRIDQQSRVIFEETDTYAS